MCPSRSFPGKKGCEAKSLELAEGDLVLEKALKCGNYGEVWRGTLTKTNEVVAVKVLLKRTHMYASDPTDDLLAEISVMLHLREQGTHPNVVEIKGYVANPSPQLVLEFIPTGSLHEYLVMMRDKDVPMTDDLAKDFSMQIAKGMKFVVDNGVVHRDLASRNVLITTDAVCKVADFGLSRIAVGCGPAGGFFSRPKQMGYMVKKESNPTAFRWTPPEGFKEIVECAKISGDEPIPHTEKGDVWSFAVVMMEIAERGAVPYARDGLRTKEEILNFVYGDGKCMTQGPMSDHMFFLAKRCWEQEPANRPNFHACIQKLTGNRGGNSFFGSFWK